MKKTKTRTKHARKSKAKAKPRAKTKAKATKAKAKPRAGRPGRWLAFVEKHGIVLASARGPVPSIAQEVAGEHAEPPAPLRSLKLS